MVHLLPQKKADVSIRDKVYTCVLNCSVSCDSVQYSVWGILLVATCSHRQRSAALGDGCGHKTTGTSGSVMERERNLWKNSKHPVGDRTQDLLITSQALLPLSHWDPVWQWSGRCVDVIHIYRSR